MRRPRKLIAIVSVNVVLLLFLLEIAGVATFYVKQGQLFYVRPSHEQPLPAAEMHPGTKSVLHPILGFIRRPGLSIMDFVSQDRLDRMAGPGSLPPWRTLSANNFGFFSEHEYPYRPPDDAYLIGIFGGSVAQWFALQGAPVLVERLRETPGLAHRRIEVLNFAQGSFKQPQQLQALAYFLARGQPLDFVLNIDGFNDIVLSFINVENGIDPSLPASQQLLPLVSLLDQSALRPEQMAAFVRAQGSEEQLHALEARMRRVWSAGAWLVLEVLRQDAARRYRTASAQLAAGIETAHSDLIHVNPWSEAGTPEDSFSLIASVWMNASMLMDTLLRARGVPYLHVIQPNQYFSKKDFSDEERRVAVSPHSPYAERVKIGYPYLLERVPVLRSQGVHIMSAVDLFDATPQPVYSDNCCHLNQFGNDSLARLIADRMASLIAAGLPHD